MANTTRTRRSSIFQWRPKRDREGLAAVFFLLPNLVGFLIFTAIPVGAAFLLAFYDYDLLLGASFAGLENFRELFTTDKVFREAFFNTDYFTAVSVPLSLVLKWIYLPDIGLINSALGIIGIDGPAWLTSERWAMPGLIIMTVWKSFGYNMVLFLAGLQNIPEHLYDAAKVDGATGWRRFLYITLPMLSPTTFFVVVISIISSFQVFDQALIMTNGGPGTATTTLVLYIYQVGFQSFKMGYAAAVALVLFAAIFIFTVVQFMFQRRWVTYD